ncbi:MAG TPA: SAM-dependent methyltransferase [Streptosporangiaceae bacterium]|jgi:hypothetical protein
MATEGISPTDLKTHIAHPARVYDYWLGGKDNFAADREVAERALVAAPDIARSARANRGFLQRAVRLTAEQGIRQFLDLGACRERTTLLLTILATPIRVIVVSGPRMP